MRKKIEQLQGQVRSLQERSEATLEEKMGEIEGLQGQLSKEVREKKKVQEGLKIWEEKGRGLGERCGVLERQLKEAEREKVSLFEKADKKIKAQKQKITALEHDSKAKLVAIEVEKKKQLGEKEKEIKKKLAEKEREIREAELGYQQGMQRRERELMEEQGNERNRVKEQAEKEKKGLIDSLGTIQGDRDRWHEVSFVSFFFPFSFLFFPSSPLIFVVFRRLRSRNKKSVSLKRKPIA